MKILLHFVALIIFLFAGSITHAQIPNSGFENWTNINNCSEPTSWHGLYSLIDSSGTFCPVTQSTDHYPVNIGNYSVRISNDTSQWNNGNILGWGILTSTEINDKPLFPVIGHPVSLSGYYKFLPENGDTMTIDFYLYYNGVLITSGGLSSSIAAPNWTAFHVFVSDPSYTMVDSARITFSASNEPKDGSAPHGNSVLYIDNINFDTASASIQDINIASDISVRPNPLSSVTTIYSKRNLSDANVSIYNSLGQSVMQMNNVSGKNITLDCNNLPKGPYYLRVTQSDNIILSDKLILTD